MSALNKKDPALLFLGDIVVFFLSLVLTLLIRYGGETPSTFLEDHIAPFSILFFVWFVVFFIAGLYEKRSIILRSGLPRTIINAQIINSLIAVLFFYFIPYFGITPKTNLFIYLVVSSLLILTWRVYGYPLLGPTRKQKAILISSGSELTELKSEVNNNPRYNLYFISSVDVNDVEGVDFKAEIIDRIYAEEVSVVAIDFKNENVEPILPSLYNLIFSKIAFIDMHKIYEDVFDRVPLSLLKYSWFLENISLAPKITYDVLKRVMDICIAIPLGAVSLVVYPFVYVAIKIEDGGPLFFLQERIGKNNTPIKIVKFRTMRIIDRLDVANDSSERVMKIGRFLRRLRIDELPQLWNVVRGDLSLIGPRPEIPSLVKTYEKEIPYYNVRHLIQPGLSGWAQLYHENHPHHGVDTRETRIKLSYDLYYIKNRSLLLDVKIGLKTLKALLSRSGI